MPAHPTPPGIAPPTPQLLPGAQRFCQCVVWLAIALALSVSISNALIWFPATRPWVLWMDFPAIRLNNAIGIACAALSLALWQIDRPTFTRAAAVLLAGVPLLIGGLTSLQYIFHLDFSIDQLFAPGTFPGDMAGAYVVNPGRMSMNAALALFFLGLALVTMERVIHRPHRTFELAPAFAVLAGLPAFGGFVGYLTGSGGFTGILRSTNILLHAAVTLFALAIGVLAARPQRAMMSRILSPGADGVLLRWMLPGSALLMFMLGWLVQRGRSVGVILPGEGAAVMLYGGLILLFALILSAGKAVSRQQGRVHKIEEALRSQEESFRALADNIPQLAWMTDESGAIVWFNNRWHEYTGLPLEEAQGWGWQKLYHPQHQTRVMEKLKRSFAKGWVWEDTFPMRGADGLYRWFLSRAMPIRDESGKVLRWFGTNTDVTEERELSEQLARAKEAAEEASNAKDHFLAALSHELRTPLTPALMSAAALRNDERLPPEVRAELTMVERNITMESRLIDDLLDLTRITHGKLALRTERCDAHELALHAMDIIRDDAHAKQVKLVLDFQAVRSGLKADPARLQQVFWNLLRNALKFTPTGGSITLTTRDSLANRKLIVEVRDTGIGFEPDAAERLFRPFEQVGRESFHQYGGGLGLGLSIARAIVDAHGGMIRAASPGQGQGAVFTLDLPGAGDPPTTRTRGSSSPGIPVEETPSLRILLVEDHEPTLMMLHKLLTRSGHAVVTANSVAMALAATVEERFDIVISDLGLPDGTGLQLMQELLQRDPSLLGIALSGYGMEEDLRRSRQAGFHQHLVKPVNFDQLKRALQSVPPPEQPHPRAS